MRAEPETRSDFSDTEQCPERLMGLHCWHSVGGNVSNQGGSSVERCCWCGERKTTTWVSEPATPIRHGPLA